MITRSEVNMWDHCGWRRVDDSWGRFVLTGFWRIRFVVGNSTPSLQILLNSGPPPGDLLKTERDGKWGMFFNSTGLDGADGITEWYLKFLLVTLNLFLFWLGHGPLLVDSSRWSIRLRGFYKLIWSVGYLPSSRPLWCEFCIQGSSSSSNFQSDCHY